MTLETITADALTPLRHGFFARVGGASSGVFAGLNCGRGSSDQADAVEINRARVAHVMGAGPESLVAIHQVHSNRAIVVDEPFQGKVPEADALVTKSPGLVLSILTADCAPVLFADKSAGVVGAAHAGWRGALGGILEATLDAMESVGASRSNTNAVVGPTISQGNYEVGQELLERFVDEAPDNSQFFINGIGDRYQFDLPRFVLSRLRDADIGHAEWSRHCTYADPDRFFSYRRSVHNKEADYGRLISTIRL